MFFFSFSLEAVHVQSVKWELIRTGIGGYSFCVCVCFFLIFYSRVWGCTVVWWSCELSLRCVWYWCYMLLSHSRTSDVDNENILKLHTSLLKHFFYFITNSKCYHFSLPFFPYTLSSCFSFSSFIHAIPVNPNWVVPPFCNTSCWREGEIRGWECCRW